MCGKSENYYAQNLNSQKLYRVYDTKIPRVRQYLDNEIDFVRKRLRGAKKILEVGAGYGRILKDLSACSEFSVEFAESVEPAEFLGIDISEESVNFGKEYLKEFPNIRLETVDAHKIDFEEIFDAVLCLQNGLSAMKGEAPNLVKVCMRALKNGGSAYFSTYSGKFWKSRLAWFEEQAEKGLLGKIDKNQTREGVIVCQDGFRAVTFTEEDFIKLGKASCCKYEIQEVDESSLFLIITKTRPV